MTSYTPSTYYNADGTTTTIQKAVRLPSLDTSDEIFFHQKGNSTRRFKFKISTSTWLDADTSNPNPDSLSNGLTSTTPSTFGGDVSGIPQPAIIGICSATGGSTVGGFANPFYSSGPTVTSITVASTVSATRQFTVTHTGTLTANDISYKINGVDITTLTSPNTPITNLQTTSTGSTFDSYTMSSAGYHIINIGSQYLEFYKSVSLNAQTSFPELTNAGLSITFPSTTADWLAKAPGFDSVTLYNDGTQYKGTSQHNGADRVEYLWVGKKYFSNADPSLRGFKYYTHLYLDYNKSWVQGNVFYIDPVARYENTQLLTSTISSASQIFYTTYLFDFVTLLAQNVSNGGGKPDRYPLIMTNLFNRNRSLYSIGMTHKDKWDLFL